MNQPNTTVDACTLTRTGRILILQLHQIEAELDALKRLFNDELKLAVENGAQYLAIQYPTKDKATAWDWFTDFVANKCLSMKYFLSANQCFAPQHALDTAPRDADSARVKLKQAKAFSRGVQDVTTLTRGEGSVTLSIFEALRDQLIQAAPDHALCDVALTRIDHIHTQIMQLNKTLSIMHHRYRDFLVTHTMAQATSPVSMNDA